MLRLGAIHFGLPLWLLLVLNAVGMPFLQAQSYTLIHNFTGRADGGRPFAGLTMDAAGNLYGTTNSGGIGQAGTVFRLAHIGSGWILTPLHSFDGGKDGGYPYAGVTIGPNGSLYGTTSLGGLSNDPQGVVFQLNPPDSVCKAVSCPWIETVLHAFAGGPNDGSQPTAGVLIDASGKLYGTTLLGGSGDYGTVYKLALSDGAWTESILYSFIGTPDGEGPTASVIFDGSGNLYGTTEDGGVNGSGTVYELTSSGSGWLENILYSNFLFPSSGGFPYGGVAFDRSGNLYGTTLQGGTGGGGTVFELSPSNGGWTFLLLYAFAGREGSFGSLTIDKASNLYGTTGGDGVHHQGNVFELTPGSDGWTYTSLHDFTGGNDGGGPSDTLLLDANGNIYGTTQNGGAHGNGVVFEITP